MMTAAKACVSSTLDSPMAYQKGMGGVPWAQVRPPSSEYRNHAAWRHTGNRDARKLTQGMVICV